MYSLTIPAGTVVRGDTAACLVVSRGAQVFATGTEARPVVFTSNRPAGQRNSGDWGGVLILGRAPVNKVEPLIEGGIIGGSYGGTDPNDNSGVFRYVRIEYPGYRFQLNNEVNGLTMGGVGRGTEIHHVQVSYSDDDSYEWFGGTVDAKYLVALGGDGRRVRHGLRLEGESAVRVRSAGSEPLGSDGSEQRVRVGQRRVGDLDGSAVDGAGDFECDAGGTGADGRAGGEPSGGGTSSSTARCCGGRRGQSIYNTVITGYPWGLRLRDVNTIAAATGDSLQMRNVSFTASAVAVGLDLACMTKVSGRA